MSVNYDALVAGNCFGDINLTSSIASKRSSESDSMSAVIETKPMINLVEDLGFSLPDLFNLARRFLKGLFSSRVRPRQPLFIPLEKQEIHITYNDNLRFVALSKQAKLGKWNASHTQDVGFLDVIGNNRKWVSKTSSTCCSVLASF